MQELRFVAVSEDGSYAVLAIPGRSGRFMLPIDDRLRAVAKGQFSRLAQYEIEVENPLRPKEIQARIRAGETVEEIADAAGIPVERVRWFEGPVLAERGYVAEQAQSASVRRQGDSTPGPRLGEIVGERLTELGADPEDAQWDSRKHGDGSWQVQLAFRAGGRLHIAEWLFDPRRRHVAPADDNAARLSLPDTELPPAAPGSLTAATVTPIRPRPDRQPFPPQRSMPGSASAAAPGSMPEPPEEPAEESVPEPARVAAQAASRGGPAAPIP
ncbi:MAG TPA: septation protein SepH, partial [Streptosporangiaceae bacterium]